MDYHQRSFRPLAGLPPATRARTSLLPELGWVVVHFTTRRLIPDPSAFMTETGAAPR
jgi:hypothetical protein